MSEETHDNIQEYVIAVKETLVEKRKDHLWQFDFVHTWVKPLSIDEETWGDEKEQFHVSLTSPKSKRSSPSQLGSPLPSFDDFFNEDEEINKQQTKARASKAKKKKSRKQAKKQRRKNRKK